MRSTQWFSLLAWESLPDFHESNVVLNCTEDSRYRLWPTVPAWAHTNNIIRNGGRGVGAGAAPGPPN
jgi:hypothetical protein